MATNNIDQLERLSQLKEKGAITVEEYEKQKSDLLSTKRPKKLGLIWKIPLGLVGLGLLISTFMGGGFPTCDSSSTKEALASAVENNTASNIVTLKLLGLKDVSETSYDEQKKERRCKGTLILNSGEEVASYRIFANGSDLLVEINGR